MTKQVTSSAAIQGSVIRHAAGHDDLIACFPVISELRPHLKDAAEWSEQVFAMRPAGYRVLAAWGGDRVLAIAGYRVMENLIHHRFLYVDDLVSAAGERGKGLGAALLGELSTIALGECCWRLVLDTAAANASARRFYTRESLREVVVGFIKPILEGA
jgi:GNAT superfamily N-acetyltransferase